MLNKDLKKIIKEAKKQCKQIGLDPDIIPNLTNCLNPQELNDIENNFSIALDIGVKTANILMEYANDMDIPLIFLMTDAEGYLLQVKGAKLLLQQLNAGIGVKMSVEEAGTSSVTLALKHNRPIALVEKDHYHTFLHRAACYTAPFEDLNTGEVMGTITIMIDKRNQNPLFLGVLDSLAKSMEREIMMKKAILT